MSNDAKEPIQSFPDENFPDLSKEKNLTEGYTNLQGYSVSLKQKDGKTLYEKIINEKAENLYFTELLTNLNINEQSKKQNFINSFKEHRDSITNFDEMFFFHYHQLASSVKATYVQRAEKLKVGKTVNEKNVIDSKLSTLLGNLNRERDNAINDALNECKSVFKECLKTEGVVDGQSNINIKKLNELLDARIKPVKKNLDKNFREKLAENRCPIRSAPNREKTTAFGGETKMITKDGDFSLEIQSIDKTSHSKTKGSAISKVSLRNAGTLLYEAFRISHLVSSKSTVDEVKIKIESFVKKSNGKPVIYNLLTSVHANEKSSIGFNDHWTNQQTRRLRILLDAQDKYNKNIQDGKYFFTINTPTNTYGREIILESSDPLIKRAAKSNLIALALILFGKDDKDVKTLIANRDSDQFNDNYKNIIKRSQPEFNDEEKKFLWERFKDGKAATHEHAKTTATCIGLCTKDSNFSLVISCKSGNERTGNIIGRVCAYLKKKFKNTNNVSASNTVQSSDIAQEINQSYNDDGVYNSGTCLNSLNDQGGNPKTKTFKEKGVLPNTNATEKDSELPNMQNKNMSCLQAHKDINFDYSKSIFPSWILWIPKKIFFPFVWLIHYIEQKRLDAQIDARLGCPSKTLCQFIKEQLGSQIHKNDDSNSPKGPSFSSD